jgi:hypothetical protein
VFNLSYSFILFAPFLSLCLWLYILCTFLKFCNLFMVFHICTVHLDIITASYLTTVFSLSYSFIFLGSFLSLCIWLYVLCTFVQSCKLFMVFHICTVLLDIITASYLTTVFNLTYSFILLATFLLLCKWLYILCTFVKLCVIYCFSHLYRASWYYHSFLFNHSI